MPRVEPQITREALFKKIGYTPHSEGQWAVHSCNSRFRIVCCGRRWGKSQWGGHEMTHKMFVPHSINWIVGPQYTLGEKEFRVVYQDFRKLGLLSSCRTQYNVEQGRMRIYFPELDSLCEVKSAQKPDSLVGEGVDHMILSESAKHSRSTWDMYLRAALADKKGSADFPSTPQGFNWYKGLYDLGMNEDATFDEYTSFKFPAWENPVLFPGGFDDPEITAIRAQVSDIFFAQEIGADFTAFEGMIYPEFNEDIHVRDFEYNPAWRNDLALDFGYVDPFVCLDIMMDSTQRVWVWREYMVSYKSTHEHGLILQNRENPDGYHFDCVAADPRGADEIATLQWVLGGIQANVVGRNLGYEAIKRAMKVREDGLPGLIIHPRCQNLIRQMRNLRMEQSRDDHNSKEKQLDKDDHGPDALRYYFNEFHVLNGGVTLSDLYGKDYNKSEAKSFFTYEGGLALDRPIGIELGSLHHARS